MSSSSASYQLLPQDSGSPHESGHYPPLGEKPKGQAGAVTARYSYFTTGAIAVVAACFIVDSIALVYMIFLSSKAPVSLDQLPLRHTYSTLDYLYNGTNFRSGLQDPLINTPMAFALVNRSQPAKVTLDPQDMSMTDEGFIPVGERRLLVTPSVSTIMQMRVLDYGMENCSITFRHKSHRSTRALATLPATIRGSQGDSALLNVWSLASDRKLDFGKLAWNTKPPRRTFLGALRVGYNTTSQLPGFACPMGSYQAFEVACSPEDSVCHVEVNSRSMEHSGLYLTQYPTV
ncbi:hypothetical protein HGRIS_006062 [Hohenbuehelia grisea]|uniref:Ubiquitin 3 binding protein But2 C-terminal domain-containing protein n=1 Tax=Hohenbuehelia grisea TaxID=104357 RepID=A0ABR3JZU6_9AGAR